MNLLNWFVPQAHAATWTLGSFNFIQSYNGSFDQLLGTIINLVFVIAGLVAFIYMLTAGFSYITAGGDSDKAAKGGKGITNALVGVIIIIAAFTIVHFVGASLFTSGSTTPATTNNGLNSLPNTTSTVNPNCVTQTQDTNECKTASGLYTGANGSEVPSSTPYLTINQGTPRLTN